MFKVAVNFEGDGIASAGLHTPPIIPFKRIVHFGVDFGVPSIDVKYMSPIEEGEVFGSMCMKAVDVEGASKLVGEDVV